MNWHATRHWNCGKLCFFLTQLFQRHAGDEPATVPAEGIEDELVEEAHAATFRMLRMAYPSLRAEGENAHATCSGEVI